MKIFLLLFFWLLWYLNYSSRAILSPLLPIIEGALSISHAKAGGLYFPFYLGSTFSVVSAGVLSLRLGYKKLIVACFLILCASYVALRFAYNYELFIVFCFFLGLGSGLYIPCAIPMITAVFDKRHWGKAISIHETAAGFGLLTVPFLTVVTLGFISWQTLFLVQAGACLMAMLAVCAYLPDPQPVREKLAASTHLFKRKAFWLITLTFVLCGISSMGIYNIIPLFLVNERGMSLDAANTLFGISRVGGFIAMALIGFILDRFNTRKILVTIVVSTGLFTAAVALAQDYRILFAMLFSQATFSVVFFPVGLTAIAKVTDQSERGLFTAVAMSAAGILGPGISPILLGLLADIWSFQLGILTVGVLTMGCSISLYWFEDI